MNLSALLFVGLFFVGIVTVVSEEETDLSHNELIRAYCSLVKSEKFYRYYKLRDHCALNVQVFGKKVI